MRQGYVRVVSTTNNAALDWYARGRLHTSQSHCEGVVYHAGLKEDGSVYWQKGIPHSG
jgi:hypothetical protein